MSDLWQATERTDGRYDLTYDGVVIGLIDHKSHAFRLVAAANACSMVSHSELEGLDVSWLVSAASSFLTMLGVYNPREIIKQAQPSAHEHALAFEYLRQAREQASSVLPQSVTEKSVG